ncbi:hypothetical protein A0H81_05693 [Grifola frondosa]|uniref:DUF6534 domain-containing protein n=1 Tax=Grifola frondosa TaxID=5627 RepID=A0A1C7MD09_GRIFR|nr:hypothetical protein A0H81_05693 [Grifola frondosa]
MTELDSTIGAVFLGVLVSAVLFGLSVCWLWLLDAFHLALSVHLVYYYLVINYANPSALLDIVWSFKVQIVVDAIVVVSVHTLYTIRLWQMLAIEDRLAPFTVSDLSSPWPCERDPELLTNIPNTACGRRSRVRRVLPWLVSVLVFLGYGVAAILSYQIMDQFTELLKTRWVTYVSLGSATIIDVVIASSLCFFLARCRTGLGGMDSTITVLMVYTLNTGVITSVCSLASIASMAIAPSTFVVIAIEFLVTKLYVNSFLAMFNARSTLRIPEQLDGISPRSPRPPGELKSISFSCTPERTLDSAYASQTHLPVSETDLGLRLAESISCEEICVVEQIMDQARELSPLSFARAPSPQKSTARSLSGGEGRYTRFAVTAGRSRRSLAFPVYGSGLRLSSLDDIPGTEPQRSAVTPDGSAYPPHQQLNRRFFVPLCYLSSPQSLFLLLYSPSLVQVLFLFPFPRFRPFTHASVILTLLGHCLYSFLSEVLNVS